MKPGEDCRGRRPTVEVDVHAVSSSTANIIEVDGPLRECSSCAASLAEIAVQQSAGWRGVRGIGTGCLRVVSTGVQEHAKGRCRHAARFHSRSGFGSQHSDPGCRVPRDAQCRDRSTGQQTQGLKSTSEKLNLSAEVADPRQPASNTCIAMRAAQSW